MNNENRKCSSLQEVNPNCWIHEKNNDLRWYCHCNAAFVPGRGVVSSSRRIQSDRAPENYLEVGPLGNSKSTFDKTCIARFQRCSMAKRVLISAYDYQ
jgi:hypothetical protein